MCEIVMAHGVGWNAILKSMCTCCAFEMQCKPIAMHAATDFDEMQCGCAVKYETTCVVDRSEAEIFGRSCRSQEDS